jgi:hypothetical protein
MGVRQNLTEVGLIIQIVASPDIKVLFYTFHLMPYAFYLVMHQKVAW